MQKTYKNNTNIDQIFYDWHGAPHLLKPGQQFVDNVPGDPTGIIQMRGGYIDVVDGITLVVLAKDIDGKVVFGYGSTTPPAHKTGFAKGCIFTNTAIGGVYENLGNGTDASFDRIAGIAPEQIILVDGKLLVGGTDDLAHAQALSGDATLGADGALTLADKYRNRSEVVISGTNAAGLSSALVLANPLVVAMNGHVASYGGGGEEHQAADPGFPVEILASNGAFYVSGATMRNAEYELENNTPTFPAKIIVIHESGGDPDTLGVLTITGTDVSDQEQVEEIVPEVDSEVEGIKIFKTVTSIVGSGWEIDEGTEPEEDSIMVGSAAVTEATNLVSLFALINAMVPAYAAHDLDAVNVTPTYHIAQTDPNILISEEEVTGLNAAIAMLIDMREKYNAHQGSAVSHRTGDLFHVWISEIPDPAYVYPAADILKGFIMRQHPDYDGVVKDYVPTGEQMIAAMENPHDGEFGVCVIRNQSQYPLILKSGSGFNIAPLSSQPIPAIGVGVLFWYCENSGPPYSFSVDVMTVISTLQEGRILIGGSYGVGAQPQYVTGDVLMSPVGVTTIPDNKLGPQKMAAGVSVAAVFGVPKLDNNEWYFADGEMRNGSYPLLHNNPGDTTSRRVGIGHTVVDTVDTLGTITIQGTDITGATISEVMDPSEDDVVWTSKLFKTVTAIIGVDWSPVGGSDHVVIGYGNGGHNEVGIPYNFLAGQPPMLVLFGDAIDVGAAFNGGPHLNDSSLNIGGVFDGVKALKVIYLAGINDRTL